MDKKFVHLHLHTPYSLLDGFSKINEVIEKAKNLGMDSVAITDHGVMFGVVDFYKTAKKNGIKPIIGCELYTSARTHKDKETIDKKSGHIILLAKSNEGYKNLIKLVSIGFVDGFYYKPRVDYGLLEKYSEGIICLSACLAGDVQQQILAGNYEKAKEIALRLENIYGKGNFYLEMQDHNIAEQKRVNIYLRKLSIDTKIPLVVTNDVHYVDKKDYKSHEILLCIQTGKTLADEQKMEFQTNEFYFKSQEEMYDIFSGDEEALANTQKIADMCNVEFDFNSYHLPKYSVPSNYTAFEYLKKLCDEGIKQRYEIVSDDIKNRLDFELNVINQMGYVEYFLIVWDFINYAKINNIMVGPGRGSAAGSIVSYALKITDIDPIKFGLLFERFLNPERVSMPDIDIDFCYEKRDKVIDYVKEKYGKDHVSQIITFGTFKARLAVRDSARVMGISYALADRVAKMIPHALKMSIEIALNINPDLKKLYDNDETVHNLIDVAKGIENLPRHASTHAAGVVISKNPVDNYVPLYVQDDNITTQFTMTTLEELGLLKMDFLGLRTLTVIQKTIENIKKNKNIEIDLETLDYNDKKVYELISSGKTLGIFQIESGGMRKFMKELKPEHLEDIIAGISLYRPGPMDSIPMYIKNKENNSNIKYIHEKLKPILSVTNGIMIYQEQVMQAVRDLAGYSYGRADLVRRAMSKKKMDVMEQERKNFVYGNEEENIIGCIKNGVDEESANKIFDDMIDFANYAFNKSHAAAYAVISYQTAYLKTHYKVEFMAALMSSVIGNIDKIIEYKIDCEENDVKILTPDINYSYSDFHVENDAIRFPLSALKGIGFAVADNIAFEREKNGDYTSFEDIVERLESKNINKKVVESLIKSGAIDSLIPNRASIMSNYESIINSIQLRKKNNIQGQISFFNNESIKNYRQDSIVKINEFSHEILLSMEKDILGFYLSGNPLDKYKKIIDSNVNINSVQIKEINEENTSISDIENLKIGIVGIINKIKINSTKKNNELMAFLTIEDLYSSVEVIVFPKIYAQISAYLIKDSVIFVKGRLSLEEDEDNRVIAESIQSIDDLEEIKKVYVKIDDFKNSPKVHLVENLTKPYGNAKLYFYDEKTKKVMVKDNMNIDYSDEIISRIKALVGDDNVKII
ncbi:DNA polymerase III, alpha subunit [Peptoanaerobacter stomatis]|uniref:DNA polymerase III subunit alpha n=1 Tax=Peptoanaerobacter stomatis TaxID=796937 RepID=J5UFK9_9FIRM|nr:DNA polymerase III subunit alpha [Peptoanaerobacter stomatis]EJU22129.1 DNA polymerase III, alpha subunit [Peptoanaerobacter stomatis]NWO24875.1 DNA polymerase III subunit alpha [Peptostreptococcaceae bacterium oral taxon 081]